MGLRKMLNMRVSWGCGKTDGALRAYYQVVTCNRSGYKLYDLIRVNKRSKVLIFNGRRLKVSTQF